MALKFAPFGSDIELPFYTALSTLKIDVDKLDDSARPVLGLYEPRQVQNHEDSCRMQILGNALTSKEVPAGYIRAEGKIKNVNTIEEFKTIDHSAILQTAGKQIWDAINDGTIYSIPSLLSSFTVLSFANLKKYTFSYWFAFPALHSDPVWRRSESEKPDQLTGQESTALVDEVGTWRYGTDKREHGFFLAKKVHSIPNAGDQPTTPGTPGDEIGYKWVVGSLRQFEDGFFRGIPTEDQYVSFVDPSTYPENPGWMLRNLLVLIRRRFKLHKVQILCYRDIQAKRHEARSRIMLLESDENVTLADTMPKVTGWERNSLGKLSAKVTNLAQYMDPSNLADQAVDLNLKLMKWRIAPDLDLNKIKETKCLLLGAGTLGTYVSRLLMGWGVRKITFIDNASVSFSNPVRQPLFDFKDCLDGGQKKAYRAAEALQEVYPGVDSTGFVMSVPMLGHPITDEQSSRLDYETLEKLMDDHDAIFLLMDTRESRWLPTVMGKAKNKIVLNAALGFDTWVVMRHGVFAADGGAATLGCYFCNDVVAPSDSQKDATLDQQCTVTRPGVAPMASAQLVELLSSIQQHPDGARAPAPKASTSQGSSGRLDYERDPPNHPLGLIPHQIRGFAATYQNILVSGQSYDCCSACSPKIVDEYKRSGWDFIKRALTEKDYITELSGLAEVQRLAEAAAAGGELDWDSEPELGGDNEDGELI
ncbi:ubiquitin-like modifier-activating enzyme atg7 [Acephala macrosclerotiorum]|nr:ubiquitin-like modifier-activating enzyme atg7 [Acephala macrosclerotiorum]